MKKLSIIILLFTASNVFSQDWPIKKLVMEKKAKKVAFTRIPGFNFVANKQLQQPGTYQQLSLDASFLGKVMEQRPEALQLSVPLGNGTSVTCDLVQFSLGNIKFTENNSNVLENMKIPVTYRGIVTGEQNMNTVILTVNEDYLALVATMADKVIQVSKADEKDQSLYRLYNSTQVQFPTVAINCGTKENAPAKSLTGIDLTGTPNRPAAVQDKCVNVFVDCSDSMYQWRQSKTQQTVYYVYELFNLVAGGYLNEQINIQITTINVWTTPSPFRATTRETALSQIAAYWQDNFWGNICVGLDYSLNTKAGSGRAGLAGDIGRVKAITANTCPAYTATKSACCYNDLNYSVFVQGFPTGPNTTQQQLYLVMHEMGHLLGAHHNQWCGWKLTSNPDTYGTIDSCGPIEPIDNSTPVCAQGPPPPPGGSTIMSYCVTSNANGNFVNYYNGFGVLPGNAIRNFVDQSACILTCVECFGLNNKKYNYLDALHNNIAAIKKESGPGGGNRNGPAKQQPGELFIHTKK